MTENWGIPYEGRQKPYIQKRLSITVNSSLSDGLPIALCPAETLSIGEKILVNLKNESVIVFRTVQGLQAVSAIGPHLDINLIDGFHDEQHIYCPGHGVAFNLIDGSSKCHLLRLRVYKVYDHEDKVFIEKAVNPLEIHSCGNQTIHTVCSDV
jgi:nitrite reductase/ring-hydroxylating ferredoxin subunit